MGLETAETPRRLGHWSAGGNQSLALKLKLKAFPRSQSQVSLTWPEVFVPLHCASPRTEKGPSLQVGKSLGSLNLPQLGSKEK